jgi:hypothetical protein
VGSNARDLGSASFPCKPGLSRCASATVSYIGFPPPRTLQKKQQPNSPQASTKTLPNFSSPADLLHIQNDRKAQLNLEAPDTRFIGFVFNVNTPSHILLAHANSARTALRRTQMMSLLHSRFEHRWLRGSREDLRIHSWISLSTRC